MDRPTTATTHQRTAWRLASSDGEIACRIVQDSDQRTIVTVTGNGRRLERLECDGPGDEPLHQAWQHALTLHEKYCHRPSAPESRSSAHPRGAAPPPGLDRLRTALLGAIRRVERSRALVIRCLETLDGPETHAVATVKGFRAAWEQLDLEYHLLTGKPLTAPAYRRLRGSISLSPIDALHADPRA